MGENHRTIVIGGGVIGAAAAYFVRQRGSEVALLEKETFGRGSSHGNCGLIVPSHILPLNSPGNLFNGLRWMMRADAPLRIRPRLDAPFVRWLMRFVRHCHPGHARRVAPALSALMHTAVDDFRRLIHTESIACDWNEEGVLHVFASESALNAHEAAESQLAAFGAGGTRLDDRQLGQLEPAVARGTAGAYYAKPGAHLRPDRFMAAMKRVLAGQGVTVLERMPALGFRVVGERAVAVRTPRGEMAADDFVVATGAWTPLLERVLGCPIPIQPGKGYSVTFDRVAALPRIPCIFEDAHVVATPLGGALRLGGTMEFAGYDDRLDPVRVNMLTRAAEQSMARFAPGAKGEAWCGWRPMTADGLPIIDRSPRMKNVIIAAGHNMLGLTTGPATGRLVAAMLGGASPPIDLGPFRASRFGT